MEIKRGTRVTVIATGETGVVKGIARSGNLTVLLDNGTRTHLWPKSVRLEEEK